MTNTALEYALSDSETLDEVIDCLAEHINIKTQGAVTQKDLFKIIVRAASKGDSLENTSKTLSNIPSGKNIRYHLDKINNFEELESNLNLALQSRVLPRIKKGKLKLAIDLNLIPYYGNPSSEELPYIYRSQAKQGTCSFYAYATIYVIKKGKRFTLAIRGIRNYDTSVAIITFLLASLESLQIKIKKLYLDRGFFSISVIRWLKALHIPFVMPAIRRGKYGGIRQFLKGKKSYKTTYTMKRNKDYYVTFQLWIVCKYKKGTRGKYGVEYYAYVVYKVRTSLSYLHEEYRQRFGIESSYRLKNRKRSEGERNVVV